MDDLVARLDALGIRYQLVPHSPCATAEDRTLALGVGPDLVTATAVLVTSSGPVVALVPCYRQVDVEAVEAALGDPGVRPATAAEAAAALPAWDPPAVPPLRSLAGVRVLADPEVGERAWVLVPAGSTDLSLRVRMRDLVDAGEVDLAPISAHPEYLRLAALD